MNAAVVIPPLEDFYFTPRRFASLGALRGAELLEKRGISVKVYDFAKEGAKQIALPESIGFLSDYIIPSETGSCSFFTSYRHFGPDVERCASIVAAGMHDIVFVSLFAYCYADTALQFASALKRQKPETILAAAGAGVSVFPRYFSQFFDYVLPGEAEIIFRQKSGTAAGAETMDAILSGGEEKSQAACHTVEGEFLPSVGISGADKRNLYVSAMLSRGCLKKCKFCSNHITHGRGFRKTDTGSLREILISMKMSLESLKGRKIFINIEDDNLLQDRQFFFSSLDVLKEFFAGFAASPDQVFFSAENGLDYTLLDTETCSALIDSYNFRQFNFTLASSDSSVTSSQGRHSDTERLEKILIFLGRREIPAVTYFIAGLDTDTAEKTVDSLLFLDRTPGLSGISMFYAVPGLPGFTDMRFFEKSSPSLCRGSSAYPWNNTLTTGELLAAFRLSRMINFLKKGDGKSPALETEMKKKILTEKQLYTISGGNIIKPASIDSEMCGMFFEKRQKT